MIVNGTNAQRLAGWILSVILALFLIGPSAMGKFLEWEGKDKILEHIGFSQDTITTIGIVEVVITLIFLVPRTGFIEPSC